MFEGYDWIYDECCVYLHGWVHDGGIHEAHARLLDTRRQLPPTHIHTQKEVNHSVKRVSYVE